MSRLWPPSLTISSHIYAQVNTDEAPVKYRTTWISIIVVMCFTVVAAAFMGIMLARENTRRDRLTPSISRPAPSTPQPSSHTSEKHDEAEKYAEAGISGSNGSVEGLMHVDRDLTDWEDTSFRYLL